MGSLRVRRSSQRLLATALVLTGSFSGSVHAGGFCHNGYVSVQLIPATSVQAAPMVVQTAPMIQLAPAQMVQAAPMIQLAPVQMVQAASVIQLAPAQTAQGAPVKKRKATMAQGAPMIVAPFGYTIYQLTAQPSSAKAANGIGAAPQAGRLSASDRKAILAKLKNRADSFRGKPLELSGADLRNSLLGHAQTLYSEATKVDPEEFDSSDNKAISSLVAEAMGASSAPSTPDDTDTSPDDTDTDANDEPDTGNVQQIMVVPMATVTNPVLAAPVQQLFLPVQARHGLFKCW